MGFIICILAFVFILLVLGLIFLDSETKPVLACLFVFLAPIMVISGKSYNETKYKDFKYKYSYVTNVDFNQLGVDEKYEYMKDVVYINSEIDYALENSDSFWFGIFTDKRLTNYKKISI